MGKGMPQYLKAAEDATKVRGGGWECVAWCVFLCVCVFAEQHNGAR